MTRRIFLKLCAFVLGLVGCRKPSALPVPEDLVEGVGSNRGDFPHALREACMEYAAELVQSGGGASLYAPRLTQEQQNLVLHAWNTGDMMRKDEIRHGITHPHPLPIDPEVERVANDCALTVEIYAEVQQFAYDHPCEGRRLWGPGPTRADGRFMVPANTLVEFPEAKSFWKSPLAEGEKAAK